jgi:hypothetical protein
MTKLKPIMDSHVAIIRPNGTMLDVDDAVHQITLDPQGTQFPWPARPLCDMVPPTSIGILPHRRRRCRRCRCRVKSNWNRSPQQHGMTNT